MQIYKKKQVHDTRHTMHGRKYIYLRFAVSRASFVVRRSSFVVRRVSFLPLQTLYLNLLYNKG